MARKVLLWLGMGVPGVIAFCATVPIEQARSNLAGWLHWVGVDRIPDVLQHPWTDIVTASLGVLVAGIAAWKSWRLHREMDSSMQQLETISEALRHNTNRLKQAVEHGQRAMSEHQRGQGKK